MKMLLDLLVYFFQIGKSMAFPSRQLGSVIENDLCLRYHTLLPLDLLNMAQRIRLRITQVT